MELIEGCRGIEALERIGRRGGYHVQAEVERRSTFESEAVRQQWIARHRSKHLAQAQDGFEGFETEGPLALDACKGLGTRD